MPPLTPVDQGFEEPNFMNMKGKDLFADPLGIRDDEAESANNKKATPKKVAKKVQVAKGPPEKIAISPPQSSTGPVIETQSLQERWRAWMAPLENVNVPSWVTDTVQCCSMRSREAAEAEARRKAAADGEAPPAPSRPPKRSPTENQPWNVQDSDEESDMPVAPSKKKAPPADDRDMPFQVGQRLYRRGHPCVVKEVCEGVDPPTYLVEVSEPGKSPRLVECEFSQLSETPPPRPAKDDDQFRPPPRKEEKGKVPKLKLFVDGPDGTVTGNAQASAPKSISSVDTKKQGKLSSEELEDMYLQQEQEPKPSSKQQGTSNGKQVDEGKSEEESRAEKERLQAEKERLYAEKQKPKAMHKKWQWPDWAVNFREPNLEVWVEDEEGGGGQWCVATPQSRVVDKDGYDAFLCAEYEWEDDYYVQDFGPHHVRQRGATVTVYDLFCK
eukprot:gnl/TRDRNA2_/TRDRNA2_80288_c0_seq1.p1 gnl/TRDRNA2_/TRDRNA2_80288_c0~~gnl/TRDRNA2_/TRDRNA2_80288_c0_seq1.p1  ORF type:complete len:441 (+),score=96.96 gnl/TRDRNA2_/TRDRNA2_80288_c0_seq1:102-1424(+)